MPTKNPDKDLLSVLKNEVLELEVKYPGPGPVGAKIFVNGELDGATSLHPSKRSFSIEFPAEEPGEYTIQIVIEGAQDGLLDQEGLEQPDTVERAKASWEVVVMDPDELHQTEAEYLEELAEDALALYAAGSISFSACKRLWEYFDDLPDEKREEMTTLDDFKNKKSGSNSDDE